MASSLLKVLLSISLVSLLTATAWGKAGTRDTLSSKAIDELIALQLPSVAPGTVVLITKQGKIVYEKAFGIANLQTGQIMSKDMIFRIGSQTKQFTAIAILQLAEQGKLSLTDTIQKYVKEFPNKSYPITIENLLTQTSGIINYMAIEHLDPAKVRNDYTPAQGVDFFKDEPLLFKPGTVFDYSNSNYYLLGYIIEKVSGEAYPDYLKKHLFEPAGLTHTSYIDRQHSVANTASGYSRFDGKQWENAELQNVTYLYAAGGLLSNAEDLLKWHQALQEGRLVDKRMLQKAYTAARLADGRNLEYGYGWYIRNLDGDVTIEHSGSTDGYQTNEIYLPKQDIYVVTLFNGFEQDMDWMVLSNDIARLASGKPLRQERKLNSDSLKQYAGIYIFNAEHQLVITYKNQQLFVEGLIRKTDFQMYSFMLKVAPVSI